MNAIAIGRDTSPGLFRPKYLAIAGVALLGIVLAVKLDLDSALGLDLGGDVDGNPNDPDECITARTMIQEIDADIQEYTNLMTSTSNPVADGYYLLQIARLEVEKKYIEYVYGCTSPFGNH